MTERQNKGVRLSSKGIAAIQKVADRDGIGWSEAIRRMVAFASYQMPAGWGAPAEPKDS